MNFIYLVFFVLNLAYVHDMVLFYLIVVVAGVSNFVQLLFKLLIQKKGEKINKSVTSNVRRVVSTFKLFSPSGEKK